MNKRGIELSVNFLVMFILAIVIFGLGIVFLYSLFNDAQDIFHLTQDQLDDRLASVACSARDRVCVTPNHLTGTRDRLSIFGIYVYNYFDTTTTFQIETEFALYEDGTEPEEFPYLLSLEEQTTLPILPGGQENIAIGIVPTRTTPAGQYVYNVKVTPLEEDGTPITSQLNLKKIYLTVP